MSAFLALDRFSRNDSIFEFASNFTIVHHRNWMAQNWHISVYCTFLYILFIICGQRWMKFRPRLELRYPLVFWNMLLAVFSIMGTLSSVPEFIVALKQFGFHYSCCVTDLRQMESNPTMVLWGYFFTLSKLPELGDTVFIVLRKQRLIFLHWYHHVTVLIFTWYSFSDYISTAKWFVVMNYSVHAIMYTYYMFKALKFRVPKWISVGITTAQLLQMVMGCVVNIYAYYMVQLGVGCDVSVLNIQLALLMYLSYFVLFAHFFYKSYMGSGRTLVDKNKNITTAFKLD